MAAHTFVIAEVAACHDGDAVRAYELVSLAADIGADAVKFQWTSSPERMVKRRRAPEHLAAYRLLAFPVSWHEDLQRAAAARRLDYLCPVYLPEDLPVVAPYVTRFKISSFEAPDREFVNAHRKYGKPIIVSSGMGGPYYDLDCLHCVSAYPAPPEEMNLRRIWRAGYVGLSDHSRHPWTGALAVAAGARIIEFHLRLAETDPSNADYAVARTADEAREYVANIRLAEKMLGSGDRRAMPCEKPMLRYRVRS